MFEFWRSYDEGKERLDIRKRKNKGKKRTKDYKQEAAEKRGEKIQRRKLDYGAKRGEIVWEGRVTRGGVAAEREREREKEREQQEGEGEESGCNPHPEMLCWLREDEMSVQELLQRVQCAITHVGKSSHFFSLIFRFIFHTFRWLEQDERSFFAFVLWCLLWGKGTGEPSSLGVSPCCYLKCTAKDVL